MWTCGQVPTYIVQRNESVVARITLDEKSWPTVVIRFPASYSDADFGSYLAELGAVLGRGPRALILDTRGARAPAATQRQQLMNFVKAHWAALHRLRGLAFVVDSSVARHALTAVSWVVAKPCPLQLVGSMSEAMDWSAVSGARAHVREKDVFGFVARDSDEADSRW
jgi:hypothetical protein